MSYVNKNPISKYVVGPLGVAGYQTVQSGIDAATAAGGGSVFIMPGSYTEDLTLTGTTQLVGATSTSFITASGADVTIIGVHTPPTSGYFSASNIHFTTATDVFFSAAAGTSILVLDNCSVECAAGFTFNLTNWVGALFAFAIQDNSGDNGIISNAGGATLFIENSIAGTTASTMVTSGITRIIASDILCAWTAGAGTSIISDNSVHENTITLSGNAGGLFSNTRISTGSNPAISMGSSGTLTLSAVTIDSSNNPSITGAGSGAISLNGITFSNNISIANTLTIATQGSVYATQFQLPESVGSTNGLISIGGTPFIHTYSGVNDGTLYNTFVGGGAGNFTLTTDALLNVGVGCTALNALTTGDANTAVGYGALALNQTGNLHCAFGNDALSLLDGAYGNVAIGVGALQSLLTGAANIAIGLSAGSAYVGAESNNILIGNVGGATENNTIRLGDTAIQNATYIAGIFGATVVGSAVLCNSSGLLGTVVSSERYKDNIQDLGDASADVMNLRPVSFTYKSSPSLGAQSGLIAEEVNEVMPRLVVLDKEGKPESVMYHELPVLLLNEMKKMSTRIDELESLVIKLQLS